MSSTVSIRRVRAAVPIAALALGACLLGMSARQDAVQVDRIEVVRDGRVVAVVGSSEHGGAIQLFDARGREALALGIDDGGGARIRINDSEGDQALSIDTGASTVRIWSATTGHERLVYASGPTEDADALNTIPTLESFVARLSLDVLTLQRDQHEVKRQLADINSPLAPGSDTSRLERALKDLQRARSEVERDIRHVEDDIRRQNSDVSDLRRRVSRLESRIR